MLDEDTTFPGGWVGGRRVAGEIGIKAKLSLS